MHDGIGRAYAKTAADKKSFFVQHLYSYTANSDNGHRNETEKLLFFDFSYATDLTEKFDDYAESL